MLPRSRLSLVTPASDVSRREPLTFDALFSSYSAYVARVASRLLGSGDAELDDVVQDVFWLASRRMAKIPDLIQARGWLATVTTRVVGRMLLRRRFRGLIHTSR
jgi:DNA-directed RNA polymerase specialized sigma24 family protein